MTSLDTSDLTRFQHKDEKQSNGDPLRAAFDLVDADGGGTLDRSEVPTPPKKSLCLHTHLAVICSSLLILLSFAGSAALHEFGSEAERL